MKIQTILKLSAFGILAGATLHTSHALAQAVPTQLQPSQGIVDAGRLEQQFQETPDIVDLSDNIKVPRSVVQNAPPNAENIMFELRELNIQGVSVYDSEDLSGIYQDLLGTTVSLADIYGISARITNKYRNEGYILSRTDIPAQTIEDGVVRINVIEGFVDRVVVSGDNDSTALNLIRKYAGHLSNGETLHMDTLQKYLFLINDLPGVTSRAVFSRSPTQVGAADLRIIVERKKYDGLLSIDNFGSRYLGPVQLTAAGSVNSMFGNNEEITGQFVFSPFGNNDPELAYGSVSYEQPINAIGTSARAFLSHSDTEPGFDIDIFNVRGKSTTYGVGLEHAFLRSRTRNFSVRGQFDIRNVDSKSDIDVTRKDRTRTVRIGGRYDFLDTILGFGVNSIDMEAAKGLNVLGASDAGDDALTRPLGDPQFSKLNVGVQRLQRITSDVNLLLGFSGQLSNGPLLSSEEFGVGGINVGRAYDPSEIIGDEGYSTKVELQWRQPLEAKLSGVEDYSVYSFWDFGKVWNDDATISDNDESLSSVGLGVRADFINNFQGGFAVALPLTRDVQTQDDNDARYYLNLSKRF